MMEEILPFKALGETIGLFVVYVRRMIISWLIVTHALYLAAHAVLMVLIKITE